MAMSEGDTENWQMFRGMYMYIHSSDIFDTVAPPPSVVPVLILGEGVD